jgi:hypothetical protein
MVGNAAVNIPAIEYADRDREYLWIAAWTFQQKVCDRAECARRPHIHTSS